MCSGNSEAEKIQAIIKEYISNWLTIEVAEHRHYTTLYVKIEGELIQEIDINKSS